MIGLHNLFTQDVLHVQYYDTSWRFQQSGMAEPLPWNLKLKLKLKKLRCLVGMMYLNVSC